MNASLFVAKINGDSDSMTIGSDRGGPEQSDAEKIVTREGECLCRSDLISDWYDFLTNVGTENLHNLLQGFLQITEPYKE